MEKGTWTTMGVIAALCILSVVFFEKTKKVQDVKAPAEKSAPAKPAK
jgi:hypothetical protein